MTDDQAGRRRLQPGRWLLIGSVVLLVAATVTIVVRRGDADPAGAGPTPSAAPSTSVSTSVTPRPDCSPEITQTWTDDWWLMYGFVYRSRCDQVLSELKFRATLLDPSGNQVPEGEDIVWGGQLFPGTELAAASGFLQVDRRRHKIGSLRVQVTEFATSPPANYTAWARTDVVNLTRKPGRGGYDLTGTLRAQPETVPACVYRFVLIMRDKAGKIVFARSGSKPEFWVHTGLDGDAPGADLAHSTIYAPQRALTDRPPRPDVSCYGRPVTTSA